ncbi:LapA family protein [Listeria booriae]|uniref:lipopolysaccharide assembly protein LapA domain-containing protein n=1 Tax=Listeria booriae TaxID=1552123 RepID=UPI001624758E|nr:LapA family protein [Listeria booriae]MBC1976303.1 LapA family protein [Listeria booriae]MBC2033138.1 LapA family protein [Listeria booriae]
MMKVQWQVIVGIIIAILIIVFGTTNMGTVDVQLMFWTVQWPLIIVILGSVVAGALLMICFNYYRTRKKRKLATGGQQKISKSQK